MQPMRKPEQIPIGRESGGRINVNIRLPRFILTLPPIRGYGQEIVLFATPLEDRLRRSRPYTSRPGNHTTTPTITNSINQSGRSQNIAATATYPASSINPISNRTDRTPASVRIQLMLRTNTARL